MGPVLKRVWHSPFINRQDGDVDWQVVCTGNHGNHCSGQCLQRACRQWVVYNSIETTPQKGWGPKQYIQTFNSNNLTWYTKFLASFPGPAQLSIACSTCGEEPGNEATKLPFLDTQASCYTTVRKVQPSRLLVVSEKLHDYGVWWWNVWNRATYGSALLEQTQHTASSLCGWRLHA